MSDVELDHKTFSILIKTHTEQGAATALRQIADDLEMRANAGRLLVPAGEYERQSHVTAIVLLEGLAAEFRERADRIAGGSTDIYRDMLVGAGMRRDWKPA